MSWSASSDTTYSFAPPTVSPALSSIFFGILIYVCFVFVYAIVFLRVTSTKSNFVFLYFVLYLCMQSYFSSDTTYSFAPPTVSPALSSILYFRIFLFCICISYRISPLTPLTVLPCPAPQCHQHLVHFFNFFWICVCNCICPSFAISHKGYPLDPRPTAPM